jgi:hypothetical protein
MDNKESIGGIFKIEVTFKNGAAIQKYDTSWNTNKEFDAEEVKKRFIRDKKILLTMEKNVKYISHKIICKLGY